MARAKCAISLAVLLWVFSALAQDEPPADAYFVADIELQTTEEFLELLARAEQLLVQGEVVPERGAKVTLVLHGPVLKSLLRESYLQNKVLVDQAASLSALEVIDIKACKSWMTGNELPPEHLQPFVDVVTYGPAEVKRLVEEKNYLYF